MKMICLYVLLCFEALTTPVSAAFSVGGEINISGNKRLSVNDTDSWKNLRNTRIQKGTIFNFTFEVNFEDSETLISMDIIIKGNGLKIPYTTKNYAAVEYNAREKIDLGKLKLAKDRKTLATTITNKGVQVMGVNGYFLMDLDGDSYGHINCQIEINPNPKLGQEADTVIVYSQAITQLPPEVIPQKADPAGLMMREETALKINITFPGMNLKDAYIKLYLPYDDESVEAKLAYLRLKLNDVYGISSETKTELMLVKISSYSHTATSEESTAVYTFPNIQFPSKDPERSSVVFKAVAQLQDFTGFKAGEKLETAFGIKINENIWVTRTRVRIADKRTNLHPRLQMSLSETQRISEEDKTKFRTKMTVSHTTDSNGTAYNVTLSLYMNPQMTLERKGEKAFDVIKPFNIDVDNGVIHYDLQRMSFQHSSRFAFNLTIPMNMNELKETRNFSVVYEVVYNGWRTERMYSTNLDVLDHRVIGKVEDTDGPLEISMTCPCPFDRTDRTCVCCRADVCPCGFEDPYKCTMCDNPWSCISTVPGYGKSSVLKEENQQIFSCSSRENVRPTSLYLSCFRTNPDKTKIALSPLLGLIIGMDSDTSFIYGIGNNGRGYVLSKDEGENWVTIPDEMFYNVLRKATFVNATLY